MQFHEFKSWWDLNKAKLAQFGRKMSYSEQIKSVEKMAKHGVPKEIKEQFPGKSTEHMEFYAVMLETEDKWYDNRRPYYKVYPCVVDALCKLELKFNCPCPKVPEGTISIRFAEGHEPKVQGDGIAALLVHSKEGYDKKTDQNREVLFIQVTLKENPDNGYWFFFDTNTPDMTIEECLNQNQTVENYDEIRKLATRIALTTCMLADDPEIITRDVLSKNQSRYDNETDPEARRKTEDKAKRNGVFGWSIGKNIKVTPHFRRPHKAIRHTGPGRTIPKFVLVKGCKVKGEKLTEVPTGHMLEDGTEVEDGKVTANC
jgi:hypothetical protein